MEEKKILIEKNIPIPSKRTDNCKYPFEKMEIGDSFSIDRPKNKKGDKTQTNLMAQARSFIKSNRVNWKFTSRSTISTVRIWRIE